MKNKMKNKMLNPANNTQKTLLTLLRNKNCPVVVSVGHAGSGKNFIGVGSAIEHVREKLVDKILMIRPTISVDENLGFLPGDINAKMGPWCMPFIDQFHKHIGKKETSEWIERDIICVEPLGFMRGRTFDKSFIMLDEAQNTTVSQVKMVLTRIGSGSKIYISGDLDQYDHGYEINGLSDLIRRMSLDDECMLELVEFENVDEIIRHPIIKHILKMYA